MFFLILNGLENDIVFLTKHRPVVKELPSYKLSRDSFREGIAGKFADDSVYMLAIPAEMQYTNSITIQKVIDISDH